LSALFEKNKTAELSSRSRRDSANLTCDRCCV
jgi:hypothetical protein